MQLNPPSAEEIHLRWMKSLRDEICLRQDVEADLISSEAARRRVHSFQVGRQIRTGETVEIFTKLRHVVNFLPFREKKRVAPCKINLNMI